MKRSKIIIELVKDEINVVQVMNILYLLLEDIPDQKIKKWLNYEINGYKKDKDVPTYRILNANIKGTYIVGNLKVTNHDIPLKPEYVGEYAQFIVTSPISEILQLSIAEKESKEHNLKISLHQLVAESISLVNGNIISARQELSIYAYTNLIALIKSKVLKILVELEKRYGNLDNYYIDFANIKEDKEIVSVINNIIYTDNSLHIGDKNKIESSNIGIGNEN